MKKESRTRKGIPEKTQKEEKECEEEEVKLRGNRGKKKERMKQIMSSVIDAWKSGDHGMDDKRKTEGKKKIESPGKNERQLCVRV